MGKFLNNREAKKEFSAGSYVKKINQPKSMRGGIRL